MPRLTAVFAVPEGIGQLRHREDSLPVKPLTFLSPPPPVQQPRIPIWVVGAWNRPKSMRRVLQYDGLLPTVMTKAGKHRKLRPDDVRSMKTFVESNLDASTPFDIVVEGTTPGDKRKQATASVRKWADAGATWWLESLHDMRGSAEEMLALVRTGPPA